MARLNIEAHLHRYEGKTREVFWVRHYARIETAIRRCTEYLILEGEVGDTIEFVLKINGLQVGTIRYTAVSKLDIVWNNTEAKKLRNKKLMLSR